MAVVALIPAVLAGLSAAAAAYAAGLAIGWVIAAGVAAAAVSYLSTSMMMKVGDIGTTYQSTSSQSSRSSSPSTGIPIVYGASTSRTGSIIAWQNVLNDEGSYLCTVHCVAIGELDHYIEQLLFDNKEVLNVPITQEGIVPKSSIQARYAPYLQLEVRFGGESYDGAMSLAKQYGGERWTDSFKGNGLCTITTVIRKTQDSQIDGILPNYNYALAVQTRGKKIIDILTGVIKASSNPVNILYDFITSEVYGLGVSVLDIDMDNFKIAAQYCDVKGLYCDGTISYDKSMKSNIERILQTFSGVLYQSADKFKIALDVADIPVTNFNVENIISKVQLNSGSQNDYYNVIDATYTNIEDEAYSNDIVRFPSNIEESGILVKDGTVKKKDEDYTLVLSKTQLAQLVNPEILKAKYINSTVSFSTYDALSLSVWDVITLTYPELGYVNKKFRVISKTMPFSAEQIGLCQLECTEYFDEVYQGTDKGVFSQSGKTNLPDPSEVLPPTNLQVSLQGTVNAGNTVTLSWEASQDLNLAGYYVRYKLSTATEWINIGSTNRYTTSFDINLATSNKYDYEVKAFNQIGYVSSGISVLGNVPTTSFTLPAVTGLVLKNATSGTVTDSTDFRITWDDQSDLVVKNKRFSDYFKQYEIRVYNGTTLVKTFTSTGNSFDLTKDINTVGRKPTFGVVAKGYNSGTFSAETKITVENKQHLAPASVLMEGGFGTAFISWKKSTERDYAGTQIVITDSVAKTVEVVNSTEQEFTSISLKDGSYTLKIGHYDQFGQDGIVYSTEQQITMKTVYEYTATDVQQIKDLVNLSGEVSGAVATAKAYADAEVLKAKNQASQQVTDARTYTSTEITAAKKYTSDEVTAAKAAATQQVADAKGYADTQMQAAITTANNNTSTVVTQAKKDLTTETGTKITASETKLTTAYVAADSALNQKISTLETNTNTKIADANSKITTLQKSVTDGDSANSTAITNLSSDLNSKISTANTSISNLTSTMSTADSALGTRIDTVNSSLSTSISKTNADITSLKSTVSTADAANTTAINSLKSSFNTDLTNLFTNPNAITGQESGFRSGSTAMVASSTAHTSNVYQVFSRDHDGTKLIQVTQGDVYNISAFCMTDFTGVPAIQLGMVFFNKAGGVVTWRGAVSRSASDTWGKIEGQVAVPENSVTARIWVQIGKASNDTTGSYWYITGLQCNNASIYNKVNSQITTMQSTLSASDSANATAITALDTSLNSKLTTVSSNITGLQKTVSDNQSSTADSISKLQSKVDNFESLVTWDFDGSVEGWTTTNGTMSVTNGILTLTSTATDTTLRKVPGITVDGSKYPLVRMRVRRISGTGNWDGKIYFGNKNHSHSEANIGKFSRPATDTDWNTIEVDMSGTDWVSGLVTDIRLDLPQSGNEVWQYDWVSVGRQGPGVTAFAIDTINTTAAANDSAQTTRINSVESTLTGKINTTNSTVSTLTQTVTNNNTAMGTRVTNLDSSFTTKLNATNTSITNLQKVVSDADSAISTTVSELRADLNRDQTNLFYNPNALTTLDMGLNTGGATVVTSTTAPTGSVYKLISRDSLAPNTIQCSPGDVYNLSMWTATDDTTASSVKVGMFIYNKSGGIVQYAVAASRTANSTWAKIQGQITIPANGVAFRIWLGMDKDSSDKVKYWYVTGVQVNNANNYPIVNAQISSLNTSLAAADQALATSISTLDTSFTGKLATTNGNVTSLTTLVNNNNTSIVNRVTSVESSFNSSLSSTNATITALNKLVTDNASSTATQFSTVNSQYATLNGKVTSEKRLLIRSAGNGNGASQVRDIQTNSLIKTGGRSLNMVVIEKSTLNVLATYTWDVFSNASGQVAAFNSTVASYDSTVILVVFTNDEPSANRTGIRDTLVSMGGTYTRVTGFAYRSAYICVGWPGLGEGQGLEYYDPKFIELVLNIQQGGYVEGIDGNKSSQLLSLQETIAANFSTLNTAITTASTASATSLTEAKSQLNTSIATVSTKVDTNISNLTNNINSTYSLTANANGVVSGIKLVANSGAATNSALYFVADKLVLVPSSGTTNAKTPFSVDGGIVYLNNAVIKNGSLGTALIADASITAAKIGSAQINSLHVGAGQIQTVAIAEAAITTAKLSGVLQSDNFVTGSTGWRIQRSGSSEFSNVTVRGAVYADSGTFKGRIEANDGFFNGTVKAEKIEGDVATTFLAFDYDITNGNGKKGAVLIRGSQGYTVEYKALLPYAVRLTFVAMTITGSVISGNISTNIYQNDTKIKSWSWSWTTAGTSTLTESVSVVIPANAGSQVFKFTQENGNDTSRCTISPCMVIVAPVVNDRFAQGRV